MVLMALCVNPDSSAARRCEDPAVGGSLTDVSTRQSVIAHICISLTVVVSAAAFSMMALTGGDKTIKQHTRQGVFATVPFWMPLYAQRERMIVHADRFHQSIRRSRLPRSCGLRVFALARSEFTQNVLQPGICDSNPPS